MNRKQLTSILVVVVLLGGLGLFLRYQSTRGYRASTGAMGEKVLGEFDVNEVAHVTVKHGTNQVDLVKVDGKWTVQQRGGYPANFADLSEVLRTLWELKVTQTVEVGESQLGRLQLLPAEADDQEKAGTLIDMKNSEGKTVRQVLLGKQHRRKPAAPSALGGDEGWPDGRYVMPGDGSEAKQVSLVTESFSNVKTESDQWLNKDFFKVEKIKSVAVTYPGEEATNSFKVLRDSETGDLRFADSQPGEELDSSKVSGLKSVLSYPTLNDVVTDPKPEITGLDDPKVGVLETFDDFVYTVKVGNADEDDNAYYVQVEVEATIPRERTPGEDEKEEDKEKLDQEFKDQVEKLTEKLEKEQALGKWTFLASKWSFDSMLKKRGELLAEKTDESATEEDVGPGAEPGLPSGLPTDVLEVIPSGPVPPPTPPVPTETEADTAKEAVSSDGSDETEAPPPAEPDAPAEVDAVPEPQVEAAEEALADRPAEGETAPEPSAESAPEKVGAEESEPEPVTGTEAAETAKSAEEETPEKPEPEADEPAPSTPEVPEAPDAPESPEVPESPENSGEEKAEETPVPTPREE